MDNLTTLLELADIKLIIGGRVRTQRDRLGLSQAALAAQLEPYLPRGITPQHLGVIERGETWPEYATWEALATCLGVDIEYFFAEVEAKPLKPTPEEALKVIADLVKARSIIQPAPALLADALAAAVDDAEFKNIAAAVKEFTKGRICLDRVGGHLKATGKAK